MKRYFLNILILGFLISVLPKQVIAMEQKAFEEKGSPIQEIEETEYIEPTIIVTQKVSPAELKKIEENIKNFESQIKKLEKDETKIKNILKTKKRLRLRIALKKIGIKDKKNAINKLTKIDREKKHLLLDIKGQELMREEYAEQPKLTTDKKRLMEMKKFSEAKQLRKKISPLESEVKKLKTEFNKKYSRKKFPKNASKEFKELFTPYKI